MSGKALPSGISSGMSLTEEATARTLILALIHRYASLSREDGDHHETPSLFEPNSTIRFPDGREISPGNLGDITRDNPPDLLRHHLTTIDIQFVSPDEANCQSYILAATHLKMPDHWGRWDDVVRRQDNGTWLFQQKTVIVDGLDPDGWLAQTLALR